MSDDIIKRLREAIAEHPLSPIHGYGADIAALLDRLDAAERENERLRSESKAQLEELDRIDDALGTNEGPSAVDHIVILKTENERLRKFAGMVLDRAREEFTDVSCRDIVDFAKQFGLLEPVTMTSACGYDCSCAEWANFPIKCLRPTALGSAAIDAAMAAEQSDERRGA